MNTVPGDLTSRTMSSISRAVSVEGELAPQIHGTPQLHGTKMMNMSLALQISLIALVSRITGNLCPICDYSSNLTRRSVSLNLS
jgi:hypothetical protein